MFPVGCVSGRAAAAALDSRQWSACHVARRFLREFPEKWMGKALLSSGIRLCTFTSSAFSDHFSLSPTSAFCHIVSAASDNTGLFTEVFLF